MDHPKPGLKYIDAKDLAGSATRFSGLDVQDADGNKLGDVEGFVIDVQQGRPRHVAVSAGWFIHKHFLLPIGHVALTHDGDALIADIKKERVERFPGFDRSAFEQLDASGLTRFDSSVIDAFGDTGGRDLDTHFDVPEWWQSDFYQVPSETPR